MIERKTGSRKTRETFPGRAAVAQRHSKLRNNNSGRDRFVIDYI